MQKSKHLITGGGGTLGQEFVSQIKDNVEVIDNNEWAMAEMKDSGAKLILDDFSNADVRGKTVIHCAAYKHVDLCEKNRESCWINNVVKTQKLYNNAKKSARRFIFISSDKAVDPNSWYGHTKKVVEDQILGDEFGVIVRLGNILGSSGSVMPLWEKQIKEDKPLTITDPTMTRYFIGVGEAVDKILTLLDIAKDGEIVIPAMGDPVTLTDLKHATLIFHNRPLDYPTKVIGARPGEKHDEELTNKWETRIKKTNKGEIWK